MSKELKIQPQLVVGILAEGAKTEIPEEVSPELDEIFGSISINQYSKSELRKLLQELTESSSQFDVLNENSFNFPYLSALMSGILSLDKSRKEAFDFAAVAALYSFIAWFNEYEVRQAVSPIQPLLKGLLYVMDSSHRALVERSFENAVQIFMKLDKNEGCYGIIDECVEFVGMCVCPDFLLEFIRHFWCYNGFMSNRKFFEMLEKMAGAIMKHERFFDEENLVKAVTQLKNFITRLDHSAMEFLIAAGRPLTPEAAKLVVPYFAKGILGVVLVGKPIDFPSTNAKPLKIKESLLNSVRSDPLTSTGLTNYLEAVEIEKIPQLLELESLIADNVLVILKQLVRLFHNNMGFAEDFIQGFLFDLSLHETTIYFPSIFSVMLYLSREFIHHAGDEVYRLSTPVATQFYSRKVFDPAFTIYDKQNNFDIVNTFRSHALEVILSDKNQGIDQILARQMAQYPYLLAETFARFSDMASLVSSVVSRSSDFVNTLARISLSYHNLETIEEVQKEPIRIVRAAFFDLLVHLFANGSVIVAFFHNQFFCSSFFYFIFEKTITEFVIFTLHSYLMSASDADMKKASVIVTGTFNMLIEKIANTEIANLLLLALRSVNDALSYKQMYGEYFKDMCASLLKSLPSLPKEELSKQLVIEIVHFCATNASSFIFSDEQVELLTEILRNFRDPELIKSLQARFIQILAGECLPSLAPAFVIKQPRIFRLILGVMEDTSQLIKTLEFFYQLCQFSPTNVNTCASNELDMFIIAVLESEKRTEFISKEVAQMLLSLFSVLSLRHSTAQSVYRFVSLLTPTDEGVVSIYQPLFIDTINTLITKSLGEPSSSLPLTGKKIETKLDLREGITDSINIVFWLYLEEGSKDYEPYICQFWFGCTTEYHVHVNHGVLFVVQDDGVATSTAKVAEGLVPHVWYFVRVSILLGESKTYVSARINISSYNQLVMAPLEHELDFSEIRLVLDSHPVSPVQFPARIAYFGVFLSLTDENEISLFETGLRFTGSYPQTPWYYVRDFGKYSDPATTGFVDVLGQDCGLQIILPMFTQQNMRYSNGDPYGYTMEEGVQLLTSLLGLSEKSQQLFYEEKGFVILRQIIEEFCIESYTLKTYLGLYQCLQVITHDGLQKQLLTEILANFALVHKLDEMLQLRILKHWEQSLFRSIGGLAVQACPFETVLAATRKFYGTQNTKSFRKCLFRIMVYYVETEGLREEAFKCTVGSCLNCQDQELAEELINFMSQILAIPQSTTLSVVAESLTLLVSCFLRNPSERIHVAVLNLLQTCYLSGAISKECAMETVFIMTQNFPGQAMTPSLFSYLQESLVDAPFFLNLVAYFAYSLEQEYTTKFCEQLVPSDNFVLAPYWAVWPLILLSKLTSDQKDQVLDFLLKCDLSNVTQLFSQIVLIYGQYETEYEETTRKLLSILQTELTAYSPQFFDVCRFVIFFKGTYSQLTLNALARKRRVSLDPKALRSSVQAAVDPAFNFDFERRQYIEPQTIPRRFIPGNVWSSVSENPTWTFAVKNRNQGKWIHLSLSLRCLEIFKKYGDPKELFFILVLCGFIQCSEYDSINEYLDSIHILDYNLSEYRTAIELIQYHTQCSGRSQYFDLKGKPLCSPLTAETKYSELLSRIRPVKVLEANDCVRKAVADLVTQANSRNIRFGNQTQIADACVRSTALFMKHLENMLEEESNNQEWKNLWRLLSMRKAPWHDRKKEESETWERDTCLCFGLVPVRMRIKQRQRMISDKSSFGDLVLEAQCSRLRYGTSKSGIFQIYSKFVVFNKLKIAIPDIGHLLMRDHGFEIFTVRSRSYLFVLHDLEKTQKDIFETIQAQPDAHLDLVQTVDNEQLWTSCGYVQQWVNCELSTYEYISMMNIVGGRSFHDSKNYPIFPWLLENSDGITFNAQNMRNWARGSRKGILTDHDLSIYLRALYPSEEAPGKYPTNLEELRQQTESEMCVEYFSMPEVIPDDFTLPPNVTSKLDFVYQHRKLLESASVSATLHDWFSIWSKESDPEKGLFSGSHPYRRPGMLDPELTEIVVYSLQLDNVGCTLTMKAKNLTFNVALLLLEGKYVDYTFDLKVNKGQKLLSKVQSRSDADIKKSIQMTEEVAKPEIRIPMFLSSKKKVRAFDASSIAMANQRKFVVLENGKLWSVTKSGKATPVKVPISNIRCFSCSGRWILAGSDMSEIVSLRNNEFYHKTKLYQKPIITLAVNDVFKIFVAGTEDSVAICDLITGDVIKVIETKSRPRKITISPAWGFVVVYCASAVEKMLMLLTVNGDFIREVHINTDVSIMYCFQTTKAFDYLLYADSKGNLYANEVYKARKKEPFYHCEQPVVGLYYNDTTMTCIVVTTKGEVTFIPLSIEQFE